MSQLRLPYSQLSPSAYQGLKQALQAIHDGPLDGQLVELIFMRVSQINGCAFCLNMHGKSLRAQGETAARLDMLAGWRVSDAYSDAERCALAWAESVTLVVETGVPNAAFTALQQHFDDAQISDLTFAVSIMNAFNRLAIAMRQ